MPYKDPERRRAYIRAYNESHREHLRSYFRQYYHAHKEKCRAFHDSYDARHRDMRLSDHRDRWRYRKYGVTPEQYATMLQQQGYVCAVCGRPETNSTGKGGTRSLAVDHDHDTGKVRALLCHACNTALGKFGPAQLRRLADYAELHGIGEPPVAAVA